MKFENIKTGDVVYTPRSIRYDWNLRKTFYVPEKVIKVTKTQFTVESGNRYKKNGSRIGNHYEKAYLLGDNMDPSHYATPSLVKDQTEEMKAFETKLTLEKRFNSLSEGLTLKLNSNLSIQRLNEAVQKLCKIKKMLEGNDLNT